MYTDDDGHTWSDPVIITPEEGIARGTTNMVVDQCAGSPTFGWIFMNWFDTRNDPTGTGVNADIYAAVVNPDTLPPPRPVDNLAAISSESAEIIANAIRQRQQEMRQSERDTRI